MTAYTILKTNGAVLTTINTATVDTTATPLTLIGQGISLYGPTVAESMVHLLENFANTTAPSNPMEGMIWYDSTTRSQHLNFYSTGQWIPIGSSTNVAFIKPHILSTSQNIDFTTVAAVGIANVISTVFRFHPTALLLMPRPGVGATTNPTINLSISAPGDIMPDTVVTNFAATKSQFYVIQGATRFAVAGDTINLNVSIAATGGPLAFDAYLYGTFTFI